MNFSLLSAEHLVPVKILIDPLSSKLSAPGTCFAAINGNSLNLRQTRLVLPYTKSHLLTESWWAMYVAERPFKGFLFCSIRTPYGSLTHRPRECITIDLLSDTVIFQSVPSRKPGLGTGSCSVWTACPRLVGS